MKPGALVPVAIPTKLLPCVHSRVARMDPRHPELTWSVELAEFQAIGINSFGQLGVIMKWRPDQTAENKLWKFDQERHMRHASTTFEGAT